MTDAKLRAVIRSMQRGLFTRPKGKPKLIKKGGLYYLTVNRKLIAILGPSFVKSMMHIFD